MESNGVDLMEDKNQRILQNLGTRTDQQVLTCSKKMDHDQVELDSARLMTRKMHHDLDSARLMTVTQEPGTGDRSERDNSMEEFIIPENQQAESSTRESQLHQETALNKQASDKDYTVKGLAHTFTEPVVADMAGSTGVVAFPSGSQDWDLLR